MDKLKGIKRRVKRFLTGFSFPTVLDLPEDPVEGMPVIKGDVVYICKIVNNIAGWHPMVNTQSRQTFTQVDKNKDWEFLHDLGEFVLIAAYNDDGKSLKIDKSSNVIDADLNRCLLKVTLSKSNTGTLAVFGVSSGSCENEIVPVTMSGGDIEAVARKAEMDIDDQAEKQRQRILTAGAGQMLEYAATTEEVKKYKDDPAPKDSDYPYLMADVGILGANLSEVATQVKYIDEAWRSVGSKIKKTRRKAKDDVKKAKNNGDVTGIANAKKIDWSAIYK